MVANTGGSLGAPGAGVAVVATRKDGKLTYVGGIGTGFNSRSAPPLKSKLDTETGDQDDMRLQEAHLLRREIDAILRDDPQARLVVYGDFNDTRNSPAIRAARGPGNSPRSLEMIGFKDSKGESWTHHWETEDVYSRIDYVMISDALRKSVDWGRCKIVDADDLDGASDHRPLLVILK